jgi:uncharacterized protein (DUF924 family)
MGNNVSHKQTSYTDIIEFWFSPRVEKLWFNSTGEFDQVIVSRFLSVFEAASSGKLTAWETTPLGALALVIVLDQFPLNMFRGQARSFSAEAQARRVADQAIRQGFDEQLEDAQKAFLYLPFMHSESLADQARSLALYEKAGLRDNLKYARHHHDIVKRFGRFPHRNKILGRESTAEELDYLNSKEAFHG